MELTNHHFAGAMMSAFFFTRRFIYALAPRLLNRRLAFALATVAIFSAKLLHIYAHVDALQRGDIVRWGASFFAQDTAFLLVLRYLFGRSLGIIATWIACTFTSTVLILASISSSFYATAGIELQWRNTVVATDSSSWSMLLTGVMSCALASAIFIVIAGVLQVPCDAVFGIALDIIKRPAIILYRKLANNQRFGPTDSHYKSLSQDDAEHQEKRSSFEEKEPQDYNYDTFTDSIKFNIWSYCFVGMVLVAQAICMIARPSESSLIYMSWTLPLMPFVDFAQSKPTLANLLAYSGDVNDTLVNRTALSHPFSLNWLPPNTTKTTFPGFDDWFNAKAEHYVATQDPLKLSNLNNELLPPLRQALPDVSIRHVVMVKLESTRKDVFPIKKDGYILEQLVKSFKNTSLPVDALQRLASLTPTANFLTGDYNDGFSAPTAKKESRGGINANNAFTTSTYTLKSLVGTHCGVSPLAADFNVDVDHHIYQPCLPHILDALNSIRQNTSRGAGEDEFTSFPWSPAFMQSVTLRYDKQDRLMSKIGFKDPIDWWYLKNETKKFGVVNLTDVNYYGMPEVAVEDYLRDSFLMAKEKNERVFLSHLTSSTHHEFGIPEDEEYVPLAGDEDLDNLSHYLNAVGYVDRWLAKILGILDEQGVANETLLVVVGDHGLSIAERGSVTPYSNPHVANYHVPLVISHPHLPQINIDDAVSSIQILPTILDLLIETNSLSKSEAEAVRDLLENYEGQSLLRPMRQFSDQNGQGSWQYTVMNPGGSTIAVRDARQPDWRLIVPVFGNYEWRFSDLGSDPHEQVSLSSFDFRTLLRSVGGEYGDDASRWVEEAAVVTRWWANENYKRWQYKP